MAFNVTSSRLSQNFLNQFVVNPSIPGALDPFIFLDNALLKLAESDSSFYFLLSSLGRALILRFSEGLVSPRLSRNSRIASELFSSSRLSYIFWNTLWNSLSMLLGSVMGTNLGFSSLSSLDGS